MTLTGRSGCGDEAGRGTVPDLRARAGGGGVRLRRLRRGHWTWLKRCAAFSRAVREAGVGVLPVRFDDSELRGLVDDVVAINLHDCNKGRFADRVAARLAELDISPSPALVEAGTRPSAGVRVNEADPQRLGVQAAIGVSAYWTTSRRSTCRGMPAPRSAPG
jgi:hypothetical protein